MNNVISLDSDSIGWREILKDICSCEGYANNPQHNHTPYLLCEEMVSKLNGSTALGEKTYATLNLEVVEVLVCSFGVKPEKIWFFTQCVEKATIIKELPRYQGVNLINADYLTWSTNMKFDVSVLNPPFNDNIDLRFIQQAIKLTAPGGHVLIVHPAISSITRKPTARYTNHKKLLEGHVKSIKLFNGNPVFGIKLFYPCQIIHITPDQTHAAFSVEYAQNGDKHTDTFTTLNDVTKWGKIEEYYSLEQKILSYCNDADNCEKHLGGVSGTYLKRNIKNNYYVNLAGIRGNHGDSEMFKTDFYTTVTRTDVPEETPNKHIWFAFETKSEAENMIRYLKSSFARVSLSIFKVSANIHRGELRSIPYFPSYAQEWTRERITKELGITAAEWAFIDKVIPPYYE